MEIKNQALQSKCFFLLKIVQLCPATATAASFKLLPMDSDPRSWWLFGDSAGGRCGRLDEHILVPRLW